MLSPPLVVREVFVIEIGDKQGGEKARTKKEYGVLILFGMREVKPFISASTVVMQLPCACGRSPGEHGGESAT